MREVFILLPSQSMDSLSLAGSEEDCQQLLTAWTSVYHPDVLRLTRKTANLMYGLYIYDEPEEKILITPKPTMDILDSHWVDRAKSRNCTFLTDCSSLKQLSTELLRCLNDDLKKDKEKERLLENGKETDNKLILEKNDAMESNSEEQTETILDSIPGMPEVEDFWALGMMHLLSEVMAHKLQYMSYLDNFSFTRDVLSVLDSMSDGNVEKTQRNMQNAWDQLVQSRQYYAPQDGYLFDFTLLDRTYLPEEFQEELDDAQQMNLLADGATLERMKTEFPAMLETLKKAIEAKKTSLVGGEYTETELPLLTQEGIVRRLHHGLEVYQKTLGKRPTIYARRRYGLTPLLPNLLKKLGYQGALHFTLDDGKFPVSEQTRIAWKGSDGQVVEAISKVPLDAKKADAVATLPTELAKRLNIDNAFGAIFTHWAGKSMTSLWYKLLKRSCRWIPLFGNLTTFSECFDSTRYSSSDEHFSPEKYNSPYLSQYVSEKETDPISRWTRYHQLRTRLEALAGLECMLQWLRVGKSMANTQNTEDQEVTISERLLNQIESCHTVNKEFFASATQEILTAQQNIATEISSILSDGMRKNALLLLNPSSFTSQRTIDLSEAEKNHSLSRLIPDEKGVVKHHFWERNVDSRTPAHGACIEIPPFGFALVTDNPERPATLTSDDKVSRNWFFFRKKSNRSTPIPSPIIQDAETGMWVMTNEHLTLRFDPYTGHLRSVYDNTHRGNRFSQQLAVRLKSSPLDSLADEGTNDYTIMSADSFQPSIFANRCALTISGRLVARKGEVLARFTQTTTLRRDSSVVEFDVFLQPQNSGCDLGRNPWQSYIASRLAWGDPTVDFFRNVGFSTQATTSFKIEAPYFVDIRPIHYTATSRMMAGVSQEIAQRIRGREMRREDFLPERDADTEYADTRLTLLANGLPWHRNCGNRRLDTLLMVQGETTRQFRFGVAVNTPYPMKTALEFMTPTIQTGIALKNSTEHASSAWFGFVSRKNVIVTHWQTEKNGARIRFAETEGRNVRVMFRTLHPMETAEQIDFLGERINTFGINNDEIQFEMFAHEFKEIRITFKK